MSTTSSSPRYSGWTQLPALQSKYPYWNPLCVGSSIWISAHCNVGEKGMVEFNCTSNMMKKAVPYPPNFEPFGQSICGVHNNMNLVIVDGENGKLRSFNVIDRKYGPEITLPKFGWHTASLMINGNVHIMHGMKDQNKHYVIYSMKTGKMRTFKGFIDLPKMDGVTITSASDEENKTIFYKFGGFDFMTEQIVDSFYVGTLQNGGDATKPIVWRKNKYFTLKQPLIYCGAIQYGPFIVIFGGEIANGLLDEIYILDVRSRKGWIESPVKCPLKSRYIAVLDHEQNVHILTNHDDKKRHYSIPLKALIPELEETLKFNNQIPQKKVFIERLNGFQSSDGDEKCGDEGAQRRRGSTTLVESLQVEVLKVKRENTVLTRRLKESTKRVAALEKFNADLMQKHEASQHRILELEKRLKESGLNSVSLDPSQFMEWEWTQIHSWIISLEEKRFQKYESLLKDAFMDDEMTGLDLLDVTPLVIKYWGIKDRKDRECLNGYIQRMVQQYGAQSEDTTRE